MKPGDVEHTGSSGAVYVLNFGTNAMCDFEKLSGQHYGEAIVALQVPHPSMTLMRAFIQAALGEGMTDTKAGDIMDDIGGPEAFLLAFRSLNG